MASRPSYDLKIDRAQKHLIDLEHAIDTYNATHPYELLPGVEGKDQKLIYRFHFTRQPPDDVALIAGDFLSNIRAALDHLMTALAPSSNRSRVHYPIFWQGVWDPAVDSDDKETARDRRRWINDTGGLDPAALAIIKREQPTQPARNGGTHALVILNTLRNADSHHKLAFVAASLRNPIASCVGPDGATFRSRSIAPDEGLHDGAAFSGIPEGSMNVKIEGTPVVLVRVGKDDVGGYLIKEGFRNLLLDGSRALINALRQYDRIN